MTIRAAGRELPAFRTFGWIGFLAACAVALAVCADQGLSVATQAMLIGVAVGAFLALALITKALVGHEVLVYYHHEIAVLAAIGIVAWGTGAPVLRHLDATALGLGAFLAFGRLGCLAAGCCHGRPARHGVVYDERHVACGFPGHLVGVKLLAVQAIESAAAAMLVGSGVLLLAGAPGSAFGFYIAGYAVARFALEELRGDLQRRHWHGLSEAQWTSLLIAVGSAAVAVGGALPHSSEHVLVAVALLCVAPLAAVWRGRDLLGPAHVREIGSRLPVPRRGLPRVVETSLGMLLSSGLAGTTEHYTLSRRADPLSSADAERLAAVLVWLRPAARSARLVPGAAGAYHVVVDVDHSAPNASDAERAA